ncbi:MAG: cation:dicarboxylase symporter family transporter [Parachlamydiales bacterium]|jgi:Na+/H+-dicarboxylate symporter
MKIKSLYLILLAILLGALAGLFSGTEKGLFGLSFFTVFDFIGKLFLNGLMMLVIPLVASSIISGVSKVNGEKEFGKIGLKTIGTFLALNLLAVTIAFLTINLFQNAFASAAEKLKAAAFAPAALSAQTASIAQLFLNIIPPNIFEALAKGQMLGIIFFSLIFGIAINKVGVLSGTVLKGFWQGVFQAISFLIKKFMFFLPLAFFAWSLKPLLRQE